MFALDNETQIKALEIIKKYELDKEATYTNECTDYPFLEKYIVFYDTCIVIDDTLSFKELRCILEIAEMIYNK
jgi:hypothetical protein